MGRLLQKAAGWYSSEPIMGVRARYGATLFIGALILISFVVLDRGLGVLDVSARTISPQVRGDLFGSFIDVCALLLTVFLAVLSVVTTLSDDRPVVRVMKKDLKNYDELVHRLTGPVPTILILGVASIACLMVGDGPTEKGVNGEDVQLDRGWLMLLPATTLALAGGLFFQTALIARLLGAVLLFRPRAVPATADADAVQKRLDEMRATNAAQAAPVPSETVPSETEPVVEPKKKQKKKLPAGGRR